MNSELSLEEASKRLEIAFKDTENRLDIIGEKVDSALIDSQKGTGPSVISEHVSASQLLKQVHDVKSEFKSIEEQVDTLKKDQEAFITEILQELKNATLAAESLKSMVPDESSSTKTSENNKQQNTKKPKGKK